MQPYDIAHSLARALKESPEYLAYQQAKTLIKDDKDHQKMLKEYKKKEFQARAEAFSGKQNPELIKELEQLASVLQYNKEITAYLMAEHRFTQLLNDIFKIIGDAVELDTGFIEDES